MYPICLEVYQLSKKRDRTNDDFSASERRELLGRIKKLQRQLKEARKYQRNLHDANEIVQEAEQIEDYSRVESTPTCSECGEPIKVIDLGNRTLIICENGHRRTISNQTQE